MLIDTYCHIYPQRFFEALFSRSEKLGNIGKRMRAVTTLVDLDQRFREMDEYGDYRQVISLPNPPLEDVVDAAAGSELARLGNDGLAELCARYPDRFPAFVAQLSLLDVDEALKEAERAITELGARGIQIFTNIAGHPLDEDRFRPLFDMMAAHDLPIWLHPARTADMADYASEAQSRYEMWWCFGWPYETSVAMARLVFSGLFDRHPDLKIITHHLGGMVPYFDGRVGPGMEVLGSRTTTEDYSGILPALKKPHLEYFKMFYADTALFGSATGLPAGLEFFGTEQVVFASDTPFGPIGETIASLNALELSSKDAARIRSGNAARLLKMEFT